MFLDDKPQGEVTTKLKLSEAIRRGKPLVGEEAIDYKLCAMGCAWAGVTGRRMTGDELIGMLDKHRNVIGTFAKKIGVELGFDPDICAVVSLWHCGGMKALEIADKLEAQGH